MQYSLLQLVLFTGKLTFAKSGTPGYMAAVVTESENSLQRLWQSDMCDSNEWCAQCLSTQMYRRKTLAETERHSQKQCCTHLIKL